MRSIKILLPLIILLVFVACKKNIDPPVVTIPDNLKNGMLVLNEGLFQLNNSSLTWVDLASGTENNEFFTQKTGRLLGDTGNDMKRYGGKIYIVVNVSSTIEVLDAFTGKPVKQVSMLNGSVSKQPRSIAFYGNKAFIPCFDGYVDVLDTASLEIVQRIAVGTNPESIAIDGQRAFVTNSGGLNTPVMDSTVSVIDVNALTEITKITVGKNPGAIVSDGQGSIYVVARGNYSSIPSRMKKISASALTVTATYPFDAGGLEMIPGNYMLVSYTGTQASQVGLFNTGSGTLEDPSLLDLSNVQMLYSVQYNAASNRIYVLDAMGYTNTGYIRVYNMSGNYINSYHVGLNPNSILFYE